MEIPQARFLVIGDCYEATAARLALCRVGSSLITEGEYLENPRAAFGLFFFPGPFLRPARPGLRPCTGFLRIRETAEELEQVGVKNIPECLVGSRGLVASRFLTNTEVFSPEGRLRYENALREAARLCTRKIRAAMHHRRSPVRMAAA